jgi:ribosome-associated protein
MVVASGRSHRHVGAVAEQVIEALQDAGLAKGLRVDGKDNCDWVVIDQGDVILHLFRPEVRAFYNLEKLWGADRPAERPIS